MSPHLTEEEIYTRARKRVEEKKSFYVHLIVYIVVNAALIVIWAFTTHSNYWFVWPLGGWGIAIIFHFLSVFFFNKETSWERNAVEKEAERIRKHIQPPPSA